MATINVGLFAHVDAGKTSLAEQLIFLAGASKALGSVDKGSSTLDYHDIEKQRGITVFAEQAVIHHKGQEINIIDTPGHVDFAMELERNLMILDYAVLIVSAIEGIQAHTETLYQLLREKKIPTFIFVNKMDYSHRDLHGLNKELAKEMPEAIAIQQPVYEKDLYTGNKDILGCQEDSIVEAVANHIPELMDAYLMDEPISAQQLNEGFTHCVHEQELMPLVYGSATKGIGIEALLDTVVSFHRSKTNVEQQPFKGMVYQYKVDAQKGLETYIKVLQGEIHIRDEVIQGDDTHKVTHIYKVFGNQKIPVKQLVAGELGILTGLGKQEIGHVLGDESHNLWRSAFQPVLGVRILYNEEQRAQVVDCFNTLTIENPHLGFDTSLGHSHYQIYVMGKIQVEVLKEVIKHRFALEVDFEEPFVRYKETVKSVSRGFCHFEPKKHFAEVEVELSPGELGEGNSFQSNYSVDYLPVSYQKLIEKNIPDALKHGVALGAPVTDTRVVLVAGQHHLEHTHGGDFRIATIRAVQQALEKNQIQLLEPYYGFNIKVDEQHSGKIMSDLLQLGAEIHEPKQDGEKMVLTGVMPVATSMTYPITFASATSGKGSIRLEVVGYYPCHNTEEVLENDDNYIERDEKLYNSVTLLREKRKMKKVTT